MFENGLIHRIVINELQKIITQLAATAPKAYSHETLKNNCELKTQIL